MAAISNKSFVIIVLELEPTLLLTLILTMCEMPTLVQSVPVTSFVLMAPPLTEQVCEIDFKGSSRMRQTEKSKWMILNPSRCKNLAIVLNLFNYWISTMDYIYE